MEKTPINIMCYSGYKADEYPEYFFLNNKKHMIREISDRWYQNDLNPEFPAAHYFKVITSSDEQYILKHELASDSWFIED